MACELCKDLPGITDPYINGNYDLQTLALLSTNDSDVGSCGPLSDDSPFDKEKQNVQSLV